MNVEVPELTLDAVIGVVGAGTMGAGIAQVAAAAGHSVSLFDAKSGAAALAIEKLRVDLQNRVSMGKLDAQDAVSLLGRIQAVDTIDHLNGASVVIEAIVERLDAKRELLAMLEAVVSERAILASNTSSISITALGRDLRMPERLVGMHFFNPVPAMKLVEVVSGVATDPAVASAVVSLSVQWHKVPIQARSTPGFVVNRIARPFYAEALLLLQDRYAPPEIIDAALRGAGFRMGPCELMDLIGHDINFLVTESMFAANFFDRRYTPSVSQREMVDGGFLGRKTGRGFYDYRAPHSKAHIEKSDVATVAAASVTISGKGPTLAALGRALSLAGWNVEHEGQAGNVGGDASTSSQETLLVGDALICVTDGRSAAQLAALYGRPNLAVVDVILHEGTGPVCVAFGPSCAGQCRADIRNLLSAAGRRPLEIGDAPGMVVARTVCMLVNEAADAVQQGVCDESSADTAMKLGTNYPGGPFEWLGRLGAKTVCQLLDALDLSYRGERYRASALLRRRTWEQHTGVEQ